MKNKNDNGNNKLQKQAKKPQKNGDGIKILTFLKLSHVNYESQRIVNGYFLDEIIAIMEKMFGWQKENQEKFDKIKLELKTKESQGKTLDDQWKKIKDFLENLWLKND